MSMYYSPITFHNSQCLANSGYLAFTSPSSPTHTFSWWVQFPLFSDQEMWDNQKNVIDSSQGLRRLFRGCLKRGSFASRYLFPSCPTGLLEFQHVPTCFKASPPQCSAFCGTWTSWVLFQSSLVEWMNMNLIAMRCLRHACNMAFLSLWVQSNGQNYPIMRLLCCLYW